MQHFPACHQDLERWAGSEQGCYLLCRAHHLLEVVQQQQHLPLSQLLRETGEKRPATSFPDAKRLGDGWHDQGGIADRSQVHEKHATTHPLPPISRPPHAHATFPPPPPPP